MPLPPSPRDTQYYLLSFLPPVGLRLQENNFFVMRFGTVHRLRVCSSEGTVKENDVIKCEIRAKTNVVAAASSFDERKLASACRCFDCSVVLLKRNEL